MTSRRNVLRAAAATAAAGAISVLAKPMPVLAAGDDGQPVVVGGFYSHAQSQLTIANDANSNAVMYIASNVNGPGTGAGTAMWGYSTSGIGVRGQTASGVGVSGSSGGGAGLEGLATSGVGVRSRSDSGTAVEAYSASGTGVNARSDTDVAVLGVTYATDRPAVVGMSRKDATGVIGVTGTVPVPIVGRPRTAVMGLAGGSSTGVYATSASGNALEVSGKAVFSRSGRAWVAKGKTSVDVTVPGGLASTANVLATIQTYRSSTAIDGVRVNYPSAGRMRIYLTKVASTTTTTPVAWFVVG